MSDAHESDDQQAMPPVESADVNKIISKLWLLSIKTENIDAIVEEFPELWMPKTEEKVFVLQLPDSTLKCNAFYSKIINRNDSTFNSKLMSVLRGSGNDVVADEISNLISDEDDEYIHDMDPLTRGRSKSQKLVKIPSNLNLDEDGEDVLLSVDDNNPSPKSTLSDGFAAIELESTDKPETMIPVPKIVSYEYSGLFQSTASIKFIFKLPVQKILDPKELTISESYYQRITNLHLNNFIISQNHLISALQPCETIQVLDLLNVFFETPSKLSNVLAQKVWLPKLKKFSFHSKNIPGTSYTTEGYSWDQTAFFDSSKGQPANLRTIWQSRSIDVSIKTLAMEVEVNHEVQTVSFTLFRRHLGGQPIIPEYFLDSFLRNCRRFQFLQINLPELCGKLDFDSLPQDLMEMNLTGFVMTGQFQAMKPIRKLFLANCVLPKLFIDEIGAILPISASIQLSNCQMENSNLPINVKISCQ